MILEFLKKHTSKIHKEIEAKSIARSILDHNISLQDYRQLLLNYAIAYASLEQLLIHNEQHIITPLRSFIHTNKSEKLMLDLKGISINMPYLQSMEVFLPFKPAFAVGILYVLEGSMLGANVIAKHLSQCENLKKIRKHHFFVEGSKDNLETWRKLNGILAALSFTSDQQQEALTAAINAFNCFETSKKRTVML